MPDMDLEGKGMRVAGKDTIELQDIITRAVTAAVPLAIEQLTKDHDFICRFRMVDEEAAKEIGHTMGMIKDIGGGKIDAGVEVIRGNHKWLMKFQTKMHWLILTFWGALITASAVGIGTVLWKGIKAAAVMP